MRMFTCLLSVRTRQNTFLQCTAGIVLTAATIMFATTAAVPTVQAGSMQNYVVLYKGTAVPSDAASVIRNFE